MPLSPSDVRYLNQYLDRRLKNRRHWHWARYLNLLAGLFMILVGTYGFMLSSKLGGQFIFSPETFQPPLTTEHAKRLETQPSTVLLEIQGEQTLELQAKFEASMAVNTCVIMFISFIHFAIGLGLIGVTLSHWNIHRREAIFITLLREKCAVELSSNQAK